MNKLFVFLLVSLMPLWSFPTRGQLMELRRDRSDYTITDFSGQEIVPEIPEGFPAVAFKTNAPEGTIFLSYRVRANHEVFPAEIRVVDKDGFICMFNDGTLIPYVNLLGGFSPGECLEFFFVEGKTQSTSSIKDFPYPLEVKEHGYTLTAEMVGNSGCMFEIWGEGFEPNEELTILSTSGVEHMEFSANAMVDGRFVLMSLPEVDGLEGGILQFTVLASKGSVTIEAPWGKEMKDRYEELFQKENELLSQKR